MKREVPRTVIYISNQKEVAVNTDDLTLATTNKAFVGRNRWVDLGRVNNLSNVRDLAIYIQTLAKDKKIQIPHQIKLKLIEYYKKKLYKVEEFDCVAFVNLLFNLQPNTPINKDTWSFSWLLSEDTLKTGDVVLISRKTREGFISPQHVAIYLAEGIYMSKGGPNGNIIFCTLPEMKELWSCDVEHVISLKNHVKRWLKF